MELEKIREVIKNVEVLRSEKQKAKTKAAKTAKKNKKPTIGGMNSNKTGAFKKPKSVVQIRDANPWCKSVVRTRAV